MDVRTSEIFRSYLQEAIGQQNASVAFSALEQPASVSVRRNPAKSGSLQFAGAENIPWCQDGFYLEERPVFTLDPLFHAGAYYVQDSSSMFVGHIARKIIGKFKDRKVLKVLDLCAAPGGKTTDLAASLRAVRNNDFILVSNEVVKQRASVLASNAAVWGDPCVVVTSDDPVRFAGMEGYFDIILADVPCSGEGMFRKDKDAMDQWSPDNVKLCQGRQRRIVADVWPALADGGVLIYSTCTFNRFENDDNVQWIAEELGADFVFEDKSSDDACFQGVFRTKYGFSLVPGLVKGEGQYCSALIKAGRGEYLSSASNLKHDLLYSQKIRKKGPALPSGLFSDCVRTVQKGDMVKVIPETVADEAIALESRLHVLLSGCAAGIIKNGTLVPDADMALSVVFNRDAYPVADLTLDMALSFLKGNTLFLPDSGKGYVTICYDSLPLGFVKNLGNRSNNLYPKGRRIRMDIAK